MKVKVKLLLPVKVQVPDSTSLAPPAQGLKLVFVMVTQLLLKVMLAVTFPLVRVDGL